MGRGKLARFTAESRPKRVLVLLASQNIMVGKQIVWGMGSQLIMSGIEKGTETLTFMASTGV